MARRPRSSSQRRRAWYGSVTSNVAAGLILAAMSVAGTFIAGWLRVETKQDGGITIVRGDSGPLQRRAAPPPAPPIRLETEGDRPDSIRLAADLAALVRPQLRAGGRREGLSIRYRLANLALAGGADRRVDARWAIGLPGKPGAACSADGIGFHSAPNLAERLAERINISIAATERRGEPTCG